MTQETLNWLDGQLKEAGIQYQFMRWEEEPPECYFVGEYLESPSMTLEENGYQETTFLLRGFTRGSWALLEAEKAKLEHLFPLREILPSHTGAAALYESASSIQTGDYKLKSIKINLTIKEWKVK